MSRGECSRVVGAASGPSLGSAVAVAAKAVPRGGQWWHARWSAHHTDPGTTAARPPSTHAWTADGPQIMRGIIALSWWGLRLPVPHAAQ